MAIFKAILKIFKAVLKLYKYLIDSFSPLSFLLILTSTTDTNTFWSKKARECDDIYSFHVRF